MVSFSVTSSLPLIVSLIRDLGAQHLVPDFLHLKTSVMSAFPTNIVVINIVLIE